MKENVIKGWCGSRRVLWAALVLSALILAVSAWRCLLVAESCSPTAFLLTADQQAQRLYRQADYTQAAKRFVAPEWRAAALYRAGEFKAVAGIYAGMSTAKAAFNPGNVLAMQAFASELGATDISGMAFAPIGFPATSGLGIYPGEPALEDSYFRGSLRGKRTETVTYVFEKKGSFELPEIVISWWDIGQKKLKKVVLPSLEVKISAVSGSGTETTAADGKQMRTGSRLLLVILLLVVLSGIAWRFRYAIRSRWQKWRHGRSQTEKAHFRRFREACRKNDSKAAYNRLMAWLNHPETVSGAATVEQFLQAVGSEKLSKELAELDRRLFKKTAEGDT